MKHILTQRTEQLGAKEYTVTITRKDTEMLFLPVQSTVIGKNILLCAAARGSSRCFIRRGDPDRPGDQAQQEAGIAAGRLCRG